MKILLSSLNKTNLAFPSEWEGVTEEDEEVKVSYRCGDIKIFINGALVETTERDDLDVGGFMDDDELKDILVRDGLAIEE